MDKRSLYYASKFYSCPLTRVDEEYNYNNLPKLIIINIINKNIFNKTKEDEAKLDWIFTFKDKRSDKESCFKNVLSIYFIELPKFRKYGKYNMKKMKDKYPWILFFK